MTSYAQAGAVPPRLLLVNSPPLAGGEDLVAHLRDSWGVAVLPVDELLRAVDRSRPYGHRHAGEVRRRVLEQVGGTLAVAYPPLVAAAMTVTSRFDVESLLRGWRRRSVEVAHVVVRVADDELQGRIHDRVVDGHERQRALIEASRAANDLAMLPADVELDATGRTPEQVATELVRALVRLGWLGPDSHWLPARPPGDSSGLTPPARAVDRPLAGAGHTMAVLDGQRSLPRRRSRGAGRG